jgi:hypothetical protein
MRSAESFDYFYVVRPGDTLVGIIKSTFFVTSPAFIQQKVAELLRLNPHIENPDLIKPGMFLRLGLNRVSCFRYPSGATDLREMERVYKKTESPVRTIVEQNSDVLNWLTAIAGETTDAARELNQSFVASLSKPLPTLRVQEITETYAHAMIRMVKEVRSDTVRFSASVSVQVLEKKLIRVDLDFSGVRAYATKLERLTKVARALKYGGWLATAVDLGDKAVDVYKAWNTPKEELTVAKVGASTASGAIMAGASTYLVCNLLLGLESAGASLFFCSAAVGAPSAFVGGKLGEKAAEKAYEKPLGKRIINEFVHLFTIPNAY